MKTIFKWLNHIKFWAIKLLPLIMTTAFIYFGLLVLRVSGAALFGRDYAGYDRQLIIFVYSFIGLFMVWGYLRVLWSSGPWSDNPLTKRKLLRINGVALAILLDHIMNDHNSGLNKPLFSILYDVTYIFAGLSLVRLEISFLLFSILKYEQADRLRRLAYRMEFLKSIIADNKGTGAGTDNDKTQKPGFNTEGSLGKEGKDKLNREEFAKHVAQTIEKHISTANEGALTIGLYGPWGSGKSSIFDMMERVFVSKEDKPVIVRFQPWFFGKDYMNLIPEFLNKLIDSIKEHSPDYDAGLIHDLKTYRKFLTPISLRPPGLIINLKDFPTNTVFSKDYQDAEELREHIVNRLKKAKIKLVVFIDDLDRLDNKEIQMVFKLVRMIADFPKTTYVIALDEEIVSNSLAQLYSKDFSKNVGKEYLEKFIQVPLYIPACDPVLLAKLGWEMIKPILVAEELEINQRQISEILTELKVSPRNLQRLTNLLQLFLPLLKKDVFPLDLIRLLTIKVSKPNLFDFIVEHGDFFLGKTEDEETQSVLRKELKKDYAQYLFVIKKLFPLMDTNQRDEKWKLQKRIGDPEYFWTYFMYSVPQNKLSENDMDNFYSALESENSKAKAEEQQNYLVRKTSPEVFYRKLEEKIASSNENRNLMLLIYLTTKFNAEYDKEKSYTYSIEGKTITSLFSHLYNSPWRTSAINIIFANNATNLALTGIVYAQITSEEELKKDIQNYLSTCFSYSLLMGHHEDDIRRIYHAWSETAEEDVKQNILKNWSSQYGIEAIIRFLMTDVPYEDMLLLESYINVLKYVPLHTIEKGLTGLEHIKSVSNMIDEFNMGGNRYLIILSYMHNTMYDFVLNTLKLIEEKDGLLTFEFSQKATSLCELGNSEHIEEIIRLQNKLLFNDIHQDFA
ncbi:P-loop NTPase fold protein [Paenibacillus sp. FSL R10-2199]|uniref:KAP family P-loop NTPase fold protein n=1 Tax=Paenibacillus sp. FSL R10-2199 TaxID=2975348 RepID=UPI0030FA0D40